jgi:hypothetical protein
MRQAGHSVDVVGAPGVRQLSGTADHCIRWPKLPGTFNRGAAVPSHDADAICGGWQRTGSAGTPAIARVHSPPAESLDGPRSTRTVAEQWSEHPDTDTLTRMSMRCLSDRGRPSHHSCGQASAHCPFIDCLPESSGIPHNITAAPRARTPDRTASAGSKGIPASSRSATADADVYLPFSFHLARNSVSVPKSTTA